MNEDKYKELKQAFNEGDLYDAWGLVMGWRFAIADYITFIQDQATPEKWEFKPGMGGANDEAYEFQELQSIKPDVETLDRFGAVLYRYDLKLRVAGLNY